MLNEALSPFLTTPFQVSTPSMKRCGSSDPVTSCCRMQCNDEFDCSRLGSHRSFSFLDLTACLMHALSRHSSPAVNKPLTTIADSR